MNDSASYKTSELGSEGRCSWPMDDHQLCGEPAQAFRTKHWPTASHTWWYCPRHLFVIKAITVREREDRATA